MKQHNILLILAVLAILAVSFSLTYREELPAGRAVAPGSGCCEITCTDMTGFACPSEYFSSGRSCFGLDACNLGCCIDKEGYCYTNYAKGRCEKADGIFLNSRECSENRDCLVPPAYPAGSAGYPYGRGSVLSVSSRQPAVKHGDEVFVDVVASEKKAVEVEVLSKDFKKSYRLYDDGIAPDISAGDFVYSFSWHSSEHPAVSEITSVSLKSEGKSSEFYLSPSSCSPLFFPWKSLGRPKIIFASSFQDDAGARAVLFLSGFFSNLSKAGEIFDIYEVNEPVSLDDASSKCPFSLTDEDVVVVFDKNTEFCDDKGSLVVVNDKSYSKYRFVVVNTRFTKELCSYITTTTEARNGFLSTVSPPVVVINSPENNSFINKPEIPISFSVFDDDAPVFRYSLFYDSLFDKVGWGYIEANTTTTKNLPSRDGLHEIIVKIENSDGNIGWNSIVSSTNLSNFAVNSFDYDVKMDSVVVNFFYSHDYDDNLDFVILSDGFVFKRGKLLKETNISEKIALGEGSHFVQAIVEDSSRRKAFSEVYLVNTSESSLITGSSVKNIFERFSPVSSAPFPNADPQGYSSDGAALASNYAPVDDSGFFEPMKLCVGAVDSGVRYRPVKCMDKSGLSIEGSAGSKDELGDFYYEFEYSLNSCSDNVFFDVVLEDSAGAQENIFSGVVDTGYGVSDHSTKRSSGDFSKFCVYSSLNDKKCFVFAPKQCQNGFDDDDDGLVDMDDMGCLSPYDGDESDGTSECQDKIDNDFDGVADADDPACKVNGVYVKTKNNEASATTQCQDGRDNDGDLLVDMEDPGCSSAQDDRESDGTSQCQDNIDNDGNGLVDMADSGCLSPVDFTESPPQCDNRIDDDNDNFVDFPEDLGCSSRKDETETAEEGVCNARTDTLFRHTAVVSEAGISVYFELYACRERIAYEVFLKDRVSHTFYPLGSGILNGMESVSGEEIVEGSYDQVCVSTSDESFGDVCYDIS
jgi:hypothetical protein